MKRDDHAAVAERALDSLKQFSLPDDAPILIEGTFVVAYHALNGLMHKEGALAEDQHINSPTHSPLNLDELPDSVKPVWQAFVDLQELRIPYVWSPGLAGDDLREQLEGFWSVFSTANKA
jgi:hypothetical protein